MIAIEVITMKCPNCGCVFDDGCRFCGICGTALTIQKKGTHRVPLLILLALAVIGIVIFFATGGTSKAGPYRDSNYTLEDGVLHAQHDFPGVSIITVPETFGNQTVTAIGRYCFAECDDAVEIILPSTVRSIGEFAFAGCDDLRALDLPPSLTRIDSDAFRDCPSLEAVHIPASVREIGSFVFSDCSSLSFIFYDGTIAQWKALYPGELNPKTAVCCSDGNYSQAE